MRGACTPDLLSSLEVGTFLVYPSRPHGEMSHRARAAIFGIKNDGRGFVEDEPMIEFVVRRLEETLAEDGCPLGRFFGGDVILVPAPGHAPLKSTGQLWATRRLCEVMAAAGLAKVALPIVKRIETVPSSHMVRAGEARPTAKLHLDTLAAHPDLVERPTRLLVVDDVLTRGATLLGCASCLREAYPDAEIRGFAIARTRSTYDCELASPIEPAVHRIDRRGTADCDVSTPVAPPMPASARRTP